jgi:hypothetical protein
MFLLHAVLLFKWAPFFSRLAKHELIILIPGPRREASYTRVLLLQTDLYESPTNRLITTDRHTLKTFLTKSYTTKLTCRVSPQVTLRPLHAENQECLAVRLHRPRAAWPARTCAASQHEAKNINKEVCDVRHIPPVLKNIVQKQLVECI